jgi:hypothetical protein
MPDWTYGVTFAAGFVSGGVCAVAIIAWRIERLVNGRHPRDRRGA